MHKKSAAGFRTFIFKGSLFLALSFFMFFNSFMPNTLMAQEEAYEDYYEEPELDIYINGIYVDDGKPIAMINSEIVEEGDEIEGAKVIEIKDDRVILEYEGVTYERRTGEGPETAMKVIPSSAKKSKSNIIESFPKFGSSEEPQTIHESFSQHYDQEEYEKYYEDDLEQTGPRINFSMQDQKKMMGMALGMTGLMLFLGLVLAVYCGLCLHKIANKLGCDHGWWAWVPILNVFLLLELADKPFWYILLFMIPIINVVIGMLIWWAICENRGKPGWISLLLLVPFVNFLVLGYLAFTE